MGNHIRESRKTHSHFDEYARLRDFSAVRDEVKSRFLHKYVYWRLWEDMILGSISPYLKPTSFVLDAGCGTGELSSMIKNYTGQIIPVDYSRECVKRTTRKVGISIMADAKHLPFRSGSFDIVISCEVIEHLESPVQAIKELVRVCKREGTICITTPNALSAFLPTYWGSLLRHPLKWIQRFQGKLSWSTIPTDFWIFPWKLRSWLQHFRVSIVKHRYFFLLTDQSLVIRFALKYLSPDALRNFIYSVEKFEIIPLGIRQLILGKKL